MALLCCSASSAARLAAGQVIGRHQIPAIGQPDQARARHYAALTLADEIGEKHEQARARNGLGAALLAAGQPQRAHEQHAVALQLAGEIGATPQADRARAGLLAACGPAILAGAPEMAVQCSASLNDGRQETRALSAR